MLLGVTGAIVLSVLNFPPQSAALCSEPIVESKPIFLPDQGFSQILPAPENPESSILSVHIRSIGIGSDYLWVGYIPDAAKIDGVSRFSNGMWSHCRGFPLVAGQNVNDIAFKDTSIFFATDGAGIGRLDSTGWHVYTEEEGLPSNSVYDLLVDARGQVWAATDEGVARLVGEKWEVIYQASPETLASNHVHELFIDDEGNFWFGLRDRSISRLGADGTWQSFYTTTSSLQKIRGITGDTEGGIWFATDEGGILRFFRDQWMIFTAMEGLPSNSVQDVERDKFGRIWAATDKGIVYTSDYGQTWEAHSTMATLDIAFGCSTCVYNEDHIWMALKDQGLGHVRIPPTTPVLRFTSLPQRVQLKPGEHYVFKVEVQALSESLLESNGDSLRAIEPNGTPLYGAYPIIPVLGEIKPGHTYMFSNVENPIVAPNKPGVYQTRWRVWQGRRFASEPISIEFEVIP